MMQQIEAIYEDGILRPSQPLQLAQHERVQILVLPKGDDDLFDSDFAMDQNPDLAPSLEEVRASLASIQGSMDAAIDELRGEF
ncbi:MAG: antitoxin family protein [Planctomycetia bacterium]|nr:antitoxin family protein [Planctomycetia bacterium]